MDTTEVIFFNGLDSLIECIYLEDNKINDEFGKCDIFVNPENISYLTRKVVIVSRLDYPGESIDHLIKNQCTVISRVVLDRSDIKFSPYILRPNFGIMWNGYECGIDELDDFSNFDFEKIKLLFPKSNNWKLSDVTDNNGNLNYLGWALQQVGENIITDTNFQNLDVIKTRKLFLKDFDAFKNIIANL